MGIRRRRRRGHQHLGRRVGRLARLAGAGPGAGGAERQHRGGLAMEGGEFYAASPACRPAHDLPGGLPGTVHAAGA